MRFCQICQIELKEVTLHGETVDRCPTCNGIYFDRGELESIVKIVSLFQSTTLSEIDIDTISSAEKSRLLKCPADGSDMMKKEIACYTIDVCENCGGIWLDGGEISALKIAENQIKENIQLYIRLGE
ncbi:zf-TFIIB domain-containing protein [candidate division CSSED10-310 bacterium]|uniref:Zf-TFIIB domain-containing protein n=1 Tax=candidate division CSSED10-310 bacterium TaxID=2855610 RepID=A0ABV6YZ23_UNCC1